MNKKTNFKFKPRYSSFSIPFHFQLMLFWLLLVNILDSYQQVSTKNNFLIPSIQTLVKKKKFQIKFIRIQHSQNNEIFIAVNSL